MVGGEEGFYTVLSVTIKLHMEGSDMACQEKQKKTWKLGGSAFIIQHFHHGGTGFFPVPKGENDICIVDDGADSGLNGIVWVPNFGLPTTNTVLWFTDDSTYMDGLDIGEMFLNFMMPEELRGYCGVDMSSWFGENGTTVWKLWTRLMMGFKPSPYGS
eukprot:14310148-Ditylum_brightwellii.AAC.1